MFGPEKKRCFQHFKEPCTLLGLKRCGFLSYANCVLPYYSYFLACNLICIIPLMKQGLKRRRQHVKINDTVSGRSSFLANSSSALSASLIMLCGSSSMLVISTRCSKTPRPSGKSRSQRTVPLAYTSSKQQPRTTSKYSFQRHTLKNKPSN